MCLMIYRHNSIILYYKVATRKYYGLAIWVIGLSLLCHSHDFPISMGADVVGELQLSGMVKCNSIGYQMAKSYRAYNVTLSVQILPLCL